MKKLILLFFFPIISCENDFFVKEKMEVIVKNNSEKYIKSAILGAYQASNNFTDSTISEIIAPGNSTNLILYEKNLINSDGEIGLKVLFESGKQLKSSCCYLTNGHFLIKNASFEVFQDSISFKSND